MLVCWGFGAANELFEFLSALRFADAYVGGLDNAGWDLAFNSLGGLLAAIGCAALAAPADWSRAGVPPEHRPGRRPAFVRRVRFPTRSTCHHCPSIRSAVTSRST